MAVAAGMEQIQVHAVEFDWSRLTVCLRRKPDIEVNGVVRSIFEEDWDDLRHFGPNPDRVGNISQPNNSTLFYWLSDVIFNESDGELKMKHLMDYSSGSPVSRYFLVWNRRQRKSAIPLLEYVYDSFQTILDVYQFPPRPVGQLLRWHTLLVCRENL